MFIRNKTMAPLFEDYLGFALLFAGLCHDIDHTGRNNGFEINSYSTLAIRYNDLSVLENHHASTTFKVILEPKRNILKSVAEDMFRKLRKAVVQNILATDMKDHFLLCEKMKEKRSAMEDNFPQGFSTSPSPHRAHIV